MERARSEENAKILREKIANCSKMRNILRIKECREHRERMKLLTEKKEACSKKLKQLASNKFVNHSFLS